MTSAIELLRQRRTQELWQKYCGFIDLSLEEFMEIQKNLLMEQIQLLSQCELGRKLLGGKVPASVEEFRQNVLLTTYRDYIPYLPEKREDVLPEKPHVWARTSGRSGEYEDKWAPYTRGLYTKMSSYSLATFIFGSTDKRGDFVFEEGDVMLATLAPPPYMSGAVVGRGLLEQFPFRYIPPLEEAEKMEFQDRIAEGFKLAFREGIDVFFGLASVLVGVGEQFEQRSGGMDRKLLLHPRVMARLAKGLIKSKWAKRPMLPRDLWSVKVIAAGGADIELFRDRIERYWGKAPMEGYASTETSFISLQTWGADMTFVPDVGFWEFIPEKEHHKSREDPTYQPHALLLDKVKAGEVYEIVATNFHGGAFVRYRLGDLIRITALRDEKHNIDIPQMIFHSRADDIIDLGGFTLLTERRIAWALVNAKIDHVEWTARKGIEDGQPVLHLYIELKTDEQRGPKELGEAVHQALKDFDPEYRDWEEMLGGRPPSVTLLSAGTFGRYTLEKQAAGAELAHLKPVRMRPSDRVIGDLLRLSEQKAIQ
jgi:hypothetical protein